MAARSLARARRFAWSLLNPGRIEIVLVALLALIVVVSELAARRLDNVWLDLLVCAIAAMTARWPRSAGTLLAVVLFGYLFVPAGSATMGEYAPMIVILGLGMRGLFQLRRWLTLAYLISFAGYAWVKAGSLASGAIGGFVWAAIYSVIWLIGNAFHAYAEAQRQARAADLVLQRQVLARELHDTVARSFTHVQMLAERALLRGSASAVELQAISDEAAAGVDDLRWVMTLLHDPATSVDALAAVRTSLAEALTEAQDALRADGFGVSLSVDGDLGRLDEERSAVLAAVTSEAAANIIKHGDREQPCALMVRVADDHAELSFINTVAASDRPESTVQRLGLWGMRQRLTPLGGTVSAAPADGRWVTRADVPL